MATVHQQTNAVSPENHNVWLISVTIFVCESATTSRKFVSPACCSFPSCLALCPLASNAEHIWNLRHLTANWAPVLRMCWHALGTTLACVLIKYVLRIFVLIYWRWLRYRCHLQGQPSWSKCRQWHHLLKNARGWVSHEETFHVCVCVSTMLKVVNSFVLISLGYLSTVPTLHCKKAN